MLHRLYRGKSTLRLIEHTELGEKFGTVNRVPAPPGPDYDVSPESCSPGPDYVFPGSPAPPGPDYDVSPEFPPAPPGPDYDVSPGHLLHLDLTTCSSPPPPPPRSPSPAPPGPDYDVSPEFTCSTWT
ncbi:hypothetical protein WMY93_010793 [Mugilogobius chulae]|uniref:Uncharacterized protein n=1 Tax=Mugilogobius chulae TaxID=88201 RepID=A0AAW0PIS1_9GOBI